MHFSSLTHLFPMHLFFIPWKHQKTLRFPDVFREYRKRALRINGLINYRMMQTFKLFMVSFPNSNWERIFSTVKGYSFSTYAKIFRKTNISYPLIWTRGCTYKGVRNVSFSENVVYVLNKWPLTHFKPMFPFISILYNVLYLLQQILGTLK